MFETNTKQLSDKEKDMEILLSDIQQKDLKRALKCGIYKELHKRDILSDAQLNSLLGGHNNK